MRRQCRTLRRACRAVSKNGVKSRRGGSISALSTSENTLSDILRMERWKVLLLTRCPISLGRATKGREYALYAKGVSEDRGVGYEDVFAEGGGECSVLGLTDFPATVEWLDDFLGLETRF